MSSNFDAIVIGAGHNGLVAGAYLARQGLKVIILEKRPIVGGAAITEELWPGFRVSRLSYAYSLFLPRIVRELELEKNGLELLSYDPDLFVPFPDGRYMFVWNDDTKTAKEIEKFSKHDAKAYFDYIEFWKNMGWLLGPAAEQPPPPIHEFAAMFEKPEAQDLLRYLMFSSAKEILDEYFESDEVKAVFAPRGLIGTMVGPMTPGSGYVLGHHVIGGSAGEQGKWGYLKGGMGGLSNAIANSARKFGATIMTNADVSKILVKDKKAVGVELRDGKTLEAKIVASNADPKQTFLRLVGEEHFESDFVKTVKKIKDQGCVVKINAALKEIPEFKALPGKGPGPQHRGITGIGPSIDYLEKAFDDAKYGRPSEKPFLRVTFHSVTDPELAPPGKFTMSIYSQYFPYNLRNGSWDEIREEVGENIINTLAEYAPNVNNAILHKEVLTPLDLERMFSLPKGNIFHMEITPDQMLAFRPVPGWANYRTPIQGLYLCGSGTHPGGGVLGTPGYNAAQAILTDLKSS